MTERRGQLITLRAPADEPLGDAGLVAAWGARGGAARGRLLGRVGGVVARVVAPQRAEGRHREKLSLGGHLPVRKLSRPRHRARSGQRVYQ